MWDHQGGSFLQTMEPWYALHVKSRQELRTAEHLIVRGVETFAPTYKVRRRWSDRIKEVDLPLFPSYVFCRHTADQRHNVLTTPGVTSIVSFGNTPMPVSEEEMASVHAIVSSGMPFGPWPYVPRVGDRVRIEEGCMRGLSGFLVRMRDEFRVVVNVELLQRSVAVEIDRDLLRVA